MKRLVPTLLLVASLLTACSVGKIRQYIPASTPLPALVVEFADPEWDGKTIPEGQQCAKEGGRGKTPPLRVKRIPPGANAILVEFNDLDDPKLDADGGHGIVGFWLSTLKNVVLKPLPAETLDLPEGTFVEVEHNGDGKLGAYLPPCSGGKKHRYVARVVAAAMDRSGYGDNYILAEKTIALGRY